MRTVIKQLSSTEKCVIRNVARATALGLYNAAGYIELYAWYHWQCLNQLNRRENRLNPPPLLLRVSILTPIYGRQSLGRL